VLDRAKQAVKPTQVDREPAKAEAAPSTSGAPRKAAVEPLKRKIEAAEQVVNRQTRQVAELDAQLADPELYKNPGKVAELTKRRDNAKAKLDEAEATWMTLAEELAEAES
ncbi:MAG: ABC transporter ATP-binding protein, partial [Caulobacter sp.]|nr:ABC transporter ATP-binding protein [Caulobacter sp.]